MTMTGLADVGLVQGRHAAHVPAVADGEQRQHADAGVLGRVQGPGCGAPVDPASTSSDSGTRYQNARVASVERGRSSGSPPTTRPSRVLALVARHLLVHLDRAQPHLERTHPPAGVARGHPDVDVGAGHGVGGAVIRARPPRCARRGRARPRHDWPACRYDAPGWACSQARASSTVPTASPSTVRSATWPPPPPAAPRRATATRRPSTAPAGPAPSSPLVHHDLVVEGEAPHHVVEQATRPVALVGVGERLLVGGAPQVGVGDEGVGGVDDHRLGWADHELVWVGGHPLVELVGPRHQHCGRGAARPARRPRLLPERRRWCPGTRSAPRRRGPPRRCPARARWWRPPRRAARRTGRPRWRGARRRGSRPGRA